MAPHGRRGANLDGQPRAALNSASPIGASGPMFPRRPLRAVLRVRGHHDRRRADLVPQAGHVNARTSDRPAHHEDCGHPPQPPAVSWPERHEAPKPNAGTAVLPMALTAHGHLGPSPYVPASILSQAGHANLLETRRSSQNKRRSTPWTLAQGRGRLPVGSRYRGRGG